MSTRKVKKTVTGVKATDGAGVNLTRVLGHDDVYDFDPFLMLDAFDSKNPVDYTKGFPWHPHRGIETVTYLISGDIEHGDSLGNSGSIMDGSCQWMTAGSGIIHQEMPKSCPHMLGAQLWINLPKKDKLVEPKYHSIEPEMVPKVEEGGALVAVVAGEFKGVKASMQGDYVKTTYLDVNLQPGTKWEMPTPADETLFIYIVDGALETDGKVYDSKQAVLFDAGDKLKIAATEKGVRFLLLMAKPLREPIAWGGPIVMNSRAELVEAFNELEEGTFERRTGKSNN